MMADGFSTNSRISNARFISNRELPKPNNAYAKAGIAYERKVLNQLQVQCSANHAHLTKGPWLAYDNKFNQTRYCVPDALIEHDGFVLIVEVKLTFVPEGHEKLRSLYLPVVELAMPGRQYRTLMICKNLTALALPTTDSIGKVFASSPAYTHTIQWLGRGPIFWSI